MSTSDEYSFSAELDSAWADGDGTIWRTRFGIASQLPRESQVSAPPEVIARTLACMAPE